MQPFAYGSAILATFKVAGSFVVSAAGGVGFAGRT